MKNNYFDNTYIPQIVKWGRIIGWIGTLIIFLPALYITFVYGVVPARGPFITAVIAQLSVNAIWWVVEPVSFFPVLGVAGTYISNLSGNTSNLKLPCAAAAQKATGVIPGTSEASIISTIGICASVFVNTTFLVIGVVVGAQAISMLPEEIRSALTYLLPALFGAVFAQFAVDDIKTGVVAILLGVGSLIAYRVGLFNWIPLDPSIPTLLIPIAGSLIFAKVTFKDKETDTSETV